MRIHVPLEPGPGAVMVGNLLRGTRIGEASGREIGEISDADKRVRSFINDFLILQVN
jgi:hypothetical protein